jgi:8-oxo-dGTP pyrophosphatase MutT (NUDIX family)
LRHSKAALAIIERNNAWLVQWNDAWQAYSLIGGHLEAGESFRECCIREIVEELECEPDNIDVAVEPYADLRFDEFSRAAGVDTKYQWQLFAASLSERVLQNLPANCRWLTPSQIQRGFADDELAIAAQVKRVLDATVSAEVRTR